MTSSVTSSYSADDLSEQSQESAGSLHPDARGSDVVEEILFTSRCYLEITIAKRCRLHKLIRQRFALALKIQQMLLRFNRKTLRCYFSRRSYSGFSRNAKISRRIVLSIQTQEDSGEAFDEPVASFAYSVDLVPRHKELKKEQSAAVVGINQQRSS
ncbi:phospholipase D gamma 1-like [Dorcoceras hygrometricum]|uniref:Phospholipase D gamma 1-like n=1 Tax=Dorcoceras hygrometricum TaxID=472368 RepID=A0A2Z7BGU7_9LAMI|nr:phospholipase D gamma 1-like [Dorcoceras hygrometricum]